MKNFEYFDGDLGSEINPYLDNQKNRYFALDEDHVLEVSKLPFDGEFPDPRDAANSVFVTFDGFGDGEPSPDNVFESLDEFCESMGVPEEALYPNINTGEDISYGEMAEAYAKLPDEIVKAAEAKGLTIARVFGNIEDGFTTDDSLGDEFAGFIYTDDPKMTLNDLEKEVNDYNAYLKRDVYETKVYNIDPVKNEISLTPNDSFASNIYYGYEADMNGLSDDINISHYLGAYPSIGALDRSMTAQDINAAVRSEVGDPAEEFSHFDGYVSGGGALAFMHDENHVAIVSPSDSYDEYNIRESARDTFVTFDSNGDVAEESPDQIGMTISDLADHVGVDAETIEARLDEGGAELLAEEILERAKINNISILPVRFVSDVGNGNGTTYEVGMPDPDRLGDQKLGFIYSEEQNVTNDNLAETVREYNEAVNHNTYDFAVYEILDEVDPVEETRVGELTEWSTLYGDDPDTNGLSVLQDLNLYIGFGIDSYDALGRASDKFDKLQEAYRTYEKDKARKPEIEVKDQHNNKKDKDVEKNKDVDR